MRNYNRNNQLALYGLPLPIRIINSSNQGDRGEGDFSEDFSIDFDHGNENMTDSGKK